MSVQFTNRQITRMLDALGGLEALMLADSKAARVVGSRRVRFYAEHVRDIRGALLLRDDVLAALAADAQTNPVAK